MLPTKQAITPHKAHPNAQFNYIAHSSLNPLELRVSRLGRRSSLSNPKRASPPSSPTVGRRTLDATMPKVARGQWGGGLVCGGAGGGRYLACPNTLCSSVLTYLQHSVRIIN